MKTTVTTTKNNACIAECKFKSAGIITLVRVIHVSKSESEWSSAYLKSISVGDKRFEAHELMPICMNPSSAYFSPVKDIVINAPFKVGDTFRVESSGAIEKVDLFEDSNTETTTK